MESIELFVPGRLSLLGGLSDLVSPYLSLNNKLIPGYAIATPIDKGIYATVKKDKNLVFNMDDKNLNIEMNENNLQKEINSNSFYSYICGVSLYIKKRYKVEGLNIQITKMDLPIKKGLSSSAAISILLVKAFNSLYNLNLSEHEIKEIAYEGEHLAGSKCGRLDQETVTKEGLVKITFYEDHAESEEIFVKEEINIVVADLNSKKNTSKIMKDFNSCFPYAKDKKQKTVHDMVGIKNLKLVNKAAKYIQTGNKKKLGKIFNKIQKLIDRTYVVCDELKAPKLHEVLKDKTIQKLSYGGKGIGSGGDGAVQVLAKDKKTQKELLKYFKEKLKMEAFEINIKKID